MALEAEPVISCISSLQNAAYPFQAVMVVSIVAKMVINHLNVPNQRKLVVVQVVVAVVEDQVNHSF